MTLKLRLQFPMYPMLMEPEGLLPRDKRACACWYFYTIAESARQTIGSTTEDQFGLLETFQWMDKRYEQQARSVALLYSLESPAEFEKFWPYVEKQAAALGYPAPAMEYKRPLKPGLIH